MDDPPLRRATADDAAALTALQHAAYEPMAAIAGGVPLPLRVDYRDILRDMEVWFAGPDGEAPQGALILEHDADATLVWSVSVAPGGQSRGLGRQLLAFAETRARAEGRALMRLYTNVKFERNRAIYRRSGYVEVRQERIGETEPPFVIVHMEKSLSAAPPTA